ncbi:MAG: DUF4296 domain-containing protein [Bacteroidetes bacterium]|nr:DUF4296 domain-containing protein [Bacteroidota bacterium]
MNKFLVLFILAGLSILSCQKSGSELLPIKQEKLVDVLFDLYLLQARIQNNIKIDSTLFADQTALLAYHQITSKDLDSCKTLMKSDPELFSDVQRLVEDKISRFEKSLITK